jgi:glycosyltransferase involved in cell wall biosynthesis
MEKILYISHVQWDWIKQRPHFIAEYLCNYFSISFVYERHYRNKKLKFNPLVSNIFLNPVLKLPLIKYYSKLNNWVVGRQIRKLIRKNKIIWFCGRVELFLEVFAFIPNNALVIYDCMDDCLEFTDVKTNPHYRQLVMEGERELISRANIVFSSSEYLKCKIESRYNTHEKTYVINNGINLDGNLLPEHDDYNILDLLKQQKFEYKVFVYVGTISDWFDFDVLVESVNRYPQIVYLLFGPCEVKIPLHPRIRHFGPVSHSTVNMILKHSDCLIMPFKITNLVLAVNPVKLYEYIYSCRPCIATKYSETTLFEKYVYLYTDTTEYLQNIERMLRTNFAPKQCPEECVRFARENTWEKRVRIMMEIMGTELPS